MPPAPVRHSQRSLKNYSGSPSNLQIKAWEVALSPAAIAKHDYDSILRTSGSSVMPLLIPDLVFVVVLLLYTPEPVHSAAVKYYVTPSEPPNPDCPIGEPCETLDHYMPATP